MTNMGVLQGDKLRIVGTRKWKATVENRYLRKFLTLTKNDTLNDLVAALCKLFTKILSLFLYFSCQLSDQTSGS